MEFDNVLIRNENVSAIVFAELLDQLKLIIGMLYFLVGNFELKFPFRVIFHMLVLEVIDFFRGTAVEGASTHYRIMRMQDLPEE